MTEISNTDLILAGIVLTLYVVLVGLRKGWW